MSCRMPDAAQRIAVVGAGGFVGQELLRQFAAEGIRVTAVARGMPELVVDQDEHDVLSPSEATGGFDVVVNLAYPTAGAPYNYPDQNKAIIDAVNALLRDGGHLIHASSLAVFGLAVDRPVRVGPVARVRDEAYVEAKIEAEHALSLDSRRRRLSTDIVRFGNIWGRASGAWALPIVHRLVTGRPIGIEGGFGYSNTTDVANAAAYIRFLAGTAIGAAFDVRYHHLAEFSSIRWGEWVSPLADALGVTPVMAPDFVVERPDTLRGELRDGLSAFSLRRLGRDLSKDRLTGSWERSILRRFPADTRDSIKGKAVFARDERLGRPDQTFLQIMSASQEFVTSVKPDWTPPVDGNASLSGVLNWLA